jgi:hypothetical protein
VGSQFKGKTTSKGACITLSAAKAATKKCPRLTLRVTGRFSVQIDRSTATCAVHLYTTGIGINTAETLVPLSVCLVLARRWGV